MKCRHCGKEYDESYSYCPYCAEPKPQPVKKVTIDQQIKKRNKNIWVEGILLPLVVFIPVTIFVYFILGLCLFSDILGTSTDGQEITFDISLFEFNKVALIALCISIFFGVLHILIWFLSSRRDKIIQVQHANDSKSICPICGSHSIALGRKGYDWNKGFWYRMFNLKGGHYLAGMESRRVTAHCQNCGHSWLTNEEWIR